MKISCYEFRNKNSIVIKKKVKVRSTGINKEIESYAVVANLSNHVNTHLRARPFIYNLPLYLKLTLISH